MKPFVVALEGIDGSGTSVQTQRVAQDLRQEGYRVYCTYQPSSGPIGRLIRRYLANDLLAIPDDAMALLFAADRTAAAVYEEQSQADIIITDRSWASSLAYQNKMTAQVLGAWPGLLPDLYILLLVHPSVAAERRRDRNGKSEKYDTECVQEQASAEYIKLSQMYDTWRVVDGEASVAHVTESILSVIRAGIRDRLLVVMETEED